MIVKGKRIRNFEKHFGYLKDGQKICFGIKKNPEHNAAVAKAGFPASASINDAVLPARCGPITRYNAEGKQKIRRDLPKETAHRAIFWTWIELHGEDKVERSDTKFVPYQRYPREFIPPPSVELKLALGSDGTEFVITPQQTVDFSDTTLLVHTVNLILEIFGECHVFTEDLAEIIQAPIQRLNWTVLPVGTRPWAILQTELKPLLNQLSVNKQKIISQRFTHINSLGPNFVATGTAGFNGYVVFGFTQEGVYLCESMHTGNATYVFEEDWEDLSGKTKAEILNHHLQKDRIIHQKSWPMKISHLIG